MTPEQSQHILSRLYTDDDYRRGFLAGKDDFYKAQQITDPEIIAFLNALKAEQLEFFAKGLYAKRYHEVRKIIPATVYFLKEETGSLFKEFSKSPVSYGVHKHHEETLAFLAFVREARKDDGLLQEIIKFEALGVLNFIRPITWRLRVFSYNVTDIAASIRAEEKPEVKKQFTALLFKKGILIRKF